MAYENLKTAIMQVIKNNNNQEITGDLLQSTLLNIVDTIGADYKFLGIATPSTIPPSNEEGRLFYFASEAGEYFNFKESDKNEYVAIGPGISVITKEANSDYWEAECLMEIAQTFGNANDKVISQNITSLAAAQSAYNIKPKVNSDIVLKTEIGYINKNGGIESTFEKGMVLSFTITSSILTDIKNVPLYLYAIGVADPGSNFVAYTVYDSTGKVKFIGPTTNKCVSFYKASLLEVKKENLVVGDIIKVSVNRFYGRAFLSYKYSSFCVQITPDKELVKEKNIIDNNLNQWKDKKIVWIGTSISWGQTSEIGQTNPMANPYPKQIGEMLGCTVLNHSQPGMAIRYNKDGSIRYGQCLSLSIEELQAKGLATTPFKSYENAVLGFDADLYVFDSEPNNNVKPSDGDLEILNNFDIAKWKYKDGSTFKSHRDTFAGAFIFMYDMLLTEKPNAKVVLVGEYGATGFGNDGWETEFYEHTINLAIAKKFNLPIFSLFELLGYNPKNIDIYMNSDRVHPKYAAHIRMANILKEKLLEVF